MKKILCALMMLSVFAACTKEKETPAPTNNNNNGGNNNTGLSDNTFKVMKANNGGDQTVTMDIISGGAQGSGSSSYYGYTGTFSVGSNSTYDRLGIAFKTQPAAGTYTVKAGSSGNLGSGEANVNITYDGHQYVGAAGEGTVTVSDVNGKKKIVVENIQFGSGAPLGTGGTEQIPNSKLNGVLVK